MAALRQLLYLLAVALPAWTLAAHALAQAGTPRPVLERQVKAAYLYKFAGFVEWPEHSFKGADSALIIGVAGSELLAEQLERMVAGRHVNGHPVTVRRLRAGDALAALHILFVDHSMERAAAGAVYAAARGHSILTVTDAHDGLADGAMIAFVMADERLRFEVGLRLAQASGLRISARMLAVAHKVQGAT
ncbi:MAG: YfiR family protein [Pseudomonadota bacterium]